MHCLCLVYVSLKDTGALFTGLMCWWRQRFGAHNTHPLKWMGCCMSFWECDIGYFYVFSFQVAVFCWSTASQIIPFVILFLYFLFCIFKKHHFNEFYHLIQFLRSKVSEHFLSLKMIEKFPLPLYSFIFFFCLSICLQQFFHDVEMWAMASYQDRKSAPVNGRMYRVMELCFVFQSEALEV